MARISVHALAGQEGKMATIRAYWPIDMFNTDLFYGTVTQADSTIIRVTDGVNTAVYGGVGFQYANNSVVAGTLTSFRQYYYGSLLGEAVDLSVPASFASSAITSNNLGALFQTALRGHDNIYGSSGNDYLRGFDGNDLMSGGGGNDYIDGGTGFDLAGYAGQRAAYVIEYDSSNGTIVVIDKSGFDGADRLDSIEFIGFADGIYNLNILPLAASIPRSALDSLVDLYVAYFNRVPEASGLAYWIAQYNNGKSLDQIAVEFYHAGVQFSSITGYSSNMPLADFVGILYENVLGRTGQNAPEQWEIDYWLNEAAAGRVSREGMVQSFLEGARNFYGHPDVGYVPELLDNKVELGRLHAVTYGIDYNNQQEAIAKTVALAAAVTPDGIDYAVDMIGLGPDNYI